MPMVRFNKENWEKLPTSLRWAFVLFPFLAAIAFVGAGKDSILLSVPVYISAFVICAYTMFDFSKSQEQKKSS